MDKSLLEGLAEKARKSRLKSETKRDYNEFPIHSYCFENAFVTYNILQDNGFNPNLVTGTTERQADSLLQEGVNLNKIDDIEELGGFIHYWVEVDDFIIDVSSHHKDYFGEILVTSDLPDSYYRFSNSYKYAEETYKTAKDTRCRYCADDINSCSCEK